MQESEPTPAELKKRIENLMSALSTSQKRAHMQEMAASLIHEVGRRISNELELGELFKAIVKNIHETFDYYSVNLFLLDEEKEHLVIQAVAGAYVNVLYTGLKLERGEGMTWQAVTSGESQISGDVSKNPFYVRRDERGTISELTVPIMIGNEPTGVIDLQSDEHDAFNKSDMIMMETLADQVGIAINNARLYTSLRRELIERKYAEEVNRTLFEISNAVNTSPSLKELYQSIHSSLGRIIDVSNFFIALYIREKDELHFPYFVDDKDGVKYTDKIIKKVSDPENASTTSELIKTGKPILSLKEERLNRLKALGKEALGTMSEVWLGTPLITNNEVIGAMVTQSYTNPKTYSENALEIFNSVSDQVALAISRKRSETALQVSQEQIKMLSRQTEEFSLTAASMIAIKDEQEIFNRISKAIVEFSDYQCMIMSYFNNVTGVRKIIGHGGLDQKEIDRISKVEVNRDLFIRILENSDQVGRSSYYLPHTRKDVLNSEAAIFGTGPIPDSEDAWHPEDMLFVRLDDQDGNLVGIISVDQSKSGKKPTEESLRPLEIFASLVSQIIINKKAQEELRKAKEKIEQVNRETEDDLIMARQFQRVLVGNYTPGFPQNASVEESILQFTHQYLPAKILAGDFFNIFPITDHEVGVLICDVMGHGARASLYTAYMNGLIEELMPHANNVQTFITKLNRRLCAIPNMLQREEFATVFYLVANVQTGVMHYVNAGHPEPFIIHNGSDEVHKLVHDGKTHSEPALGLLEDFSYSVHRTGIQKDDVLLLYTDGLYEAMDREGNLYGRKRLMELIKNTLSAPPEEMLKKVVSDVQSFAKSDELEDDACLVAMHVVRDLG